MSQPQISELWIYPLKSGRGVPVRSLEVGPRGPVGDRTFMAVDETGEFLSQRRCPALGRVGLEHSGDRFTLQTPGLSDETFPLVVEDPLGVRVWRSTVVGADQGAGAAAWLRAALGVECRLVFAGPAHQRTAARRYSSGAAPVAYADGYPLLLATESSLAALNAAGEASWSMRRFRPNVVITGTSAWDEWRWHELRLGAMRVEVVKPCQRCSIIELDPESGERSPGPTAALRSLFRDTRFPYFGQNAVPRDLGTISIGDSLTHLRRLSVHWWPQ